MEITTLGSHDYMKQIALYQLRRTIEYADLRCLSPAEIIRSYFKTLRKTIMEQAI